ncbi:CARDB domain-containing protein [Salinirubellus sp. GCM10025818]|uniref:PKD domain-containing protein n=1 Tax=unclassified Salinirubellus TaxID=2627207 RepID=UPI003618BA10
METTTTPSRTQVLSLLMAAVVALSVTAGFAAAATTTDLTVSITDDDNTLAPGETTTVEIAVASADGGVGAAEMEISLSDPGVAAITDVETNSAPALTDNVVAGGGQSADVKYFGVDTADTGGVTFVTVTLQAAAEGQTTVQISENSQTGNLVVFDENGAGYTLDTVGSATLNVEEVNQPPSADAGDDQTVQAGDTVTLDGSDSSDPNSADTLSYSWTETTDSGVSLSDASAEQPTFTAPSVTSETTLDFELTVTDDDGATDTDTITVTIQPPDAANFQVSNLNAPSTATQGDAIDVSATVENTGGQQATKSVEFRVDTDNDGSIADESAVASQDVQLGPGASTAVTFEDVDTSGLGPSTLTHGVATPDDSATAQIEITEPVTPPADETTVSLEPADQQTAVGVTTTYDVVVDNAAGGVGAGEVAVTVDDTSVATITDLEVLNDANVDALITDSTAEFDYFGADTADSGPVTIATVTVEGAGEGTASLSIGPADGNSEVLLFDEGGTGYDVTGTNGATLEVLPVQFDVDTTSAPEKAAVGSTVTVSATISSDGAVESTQPVELLFDVDGDGTTESIETQQVTIGVNGQTEVSFDVSVPADASFGDRAYSVETVSDSAGGTVEFTPPDINGDGNLPGDLNGDGLYEDVNGDGSADSGDAQALFAARDDTAVQNNAGAFDFNDDGAVNVGDAQALFDLVT